MSKRAKGVKQICETSDGILRGPHSEEEGDVEEKVTCGIEVLAWPCDTDIFSN